MSQTKQGMIGVHRFHESPILKTHIDITDDKTGVMSHQFKNSALRAYSSDLAQTRQILFQIPGQAA